MHDDKEVYWVNERIGEYNGNCKVRDDSKECGRGQKAGEEGGRTGEKWEMNTGTDCHTRASTHLEHEGANRMVGQE